MEAIGYIALGAGFGFLAGSLFVAVKYNQQIKEYGHEADKWQRVARRNEIIARGLERQRKAEVAARWSDPELVTAADAGEWPEVVGE